MGEHDDIDHTGLTGVGGSVATDTIFDAKGDLAAGTGANTAAKLTVGANDTILMADSGQSTGLKWVASQTPSTQAFGDAAAEGTADTYARGDHKHAMPADPGGGTFSGARVYNNAGQSINTGTLTVATFNTEVFDTDGYHEGVTNPGRITIPSGKDGYFLLIANVDWETDTQVQMRIRKGGATYLPGAVVQAAGVSAGPRTNLSLSIIQAAVATDYFEVIVYQGSGGSLNVGTGSDPFRCSFEIARLGS